MTKVFLGGTCNESSWRKDLIKDLEMSYFNPVVDDWTPDCMEEERKQREQCGYCLYVITPKMTGVYSIAEVVDDSNKRPEKTVFCFLEQDEDKKFSAGQLMSLEAVAEMVRENGARVFYDLDDVARYFNRIEFYNRDPNPKNRIDK